MWSTLFEDLKNHVKTKNNNNDVTRSHQSIGLDGDDGQGGGENGLGIEPKRNIHLRENKWKKDRAARDGVVSKMSVT